MLLWKWACLCRMFLHFYIHICLNFENSQIFVMFWSVLLWRFCEFMNLNWESIDFREFQKCHFSSGSPESWLKKAGKKEDGLRSFERRKMSFFSTSHSSGNQVDGSSLAFSTEAVVASWQTRRVMTRREGVSSTRRVMRRLCELAGIFWGVHLSEKMSMFLQNLSALLQSHLPNFWKIWISAVFRVDLIKPYW